MAKIRLKRTSEFNNKMRHFKIFIDSKEIGTIADGEIKEFEIEPGTHTISTKIDWGSSEDLILNINDFETKNLKVSGYKSGNLLSIAIILLSILHIILSYTLSINYVAITIAPLFLVYIYYISIGRKKYLVLNEVL